MSIGNTNIVAKIAAVVAGLGLVAMSFAVVPAKAATSVQDQINALMAQLAALQAQQGGSMSDHMMFNTDLTVGSKGADVTALQNWLIGQGQSIPAGATGLFGPQTKAALAAWQAAHGVTPAAGFFGPITRAKVNAMAGGSTGSTSGTGSVSGLTGAGRLTNISTLGDVVSDIKEGDGVTKVAGVAVDATDGDVLLQRLDTTITLAAGSNSSSLSKYFQAVHVYVDGKKVATMDADSGDKNGKVWTFRFSGINTKIAKGHTANIYVEVTPITSVGTNENGVSGNTVALAADALRYAGADGISETYGAVVSQSFSVSAATNGKLTFTEGAGDPVASTVKVDVNNTTTGVKILELNAKAKNTDVTVNDLAVQLATSDNSLADVIQTVSLMDGSTVVRSKSVTTGNTNTIVFDNVNKTIAKDATQVWSVVVDLKKETAYSDGTTLIASTTGGLTGHDIEDTHGNSVSGGNLTGSAIGHTQTLQATGITLTSVSNTSTVRSATIAGQADIVDNSIVFKITAGDDDLFIEGDLAQGIVSPSASTDGLSWATTTDSNTGTSTSYSATLTASDTNSADVTTAGQMAFKIPAGSSRTFTLSVSIPTGTDNGQIGVRITGIKYNATTNSGDVLGSLYTSNLDTYKTTTKTGLNIL